MISWNLVAKLGMELLADGILILIGAATINLLGVWSLLTLPILLGAFLLSKLIWRNDD